MDRIVLLLLLLCTSLFSFGQSDTLEAGHGLLEGRVVYQNAYLPNARVAIYKKNSLVGKVRSDTDGRFRFKQLPEGWYRVKVTTPYQDVLISPNTFVKSDPEQPAYCDEFALLLKNLTKKKQHYPDTLLTQNIDSIVVYKSKREMCVYANNHLCKIYHISLGFTPIGAKHFQGDGKTPEGHYRINGKNPFSTYCKNLGISYPSNKDIAYAQKYGKPTGGDVKIHGLPNGEEAYKEDYIYDDWTWGCIALTNEEVTELYHYVKVGVPIEILP